ncbi:MAG TPA: hypothetical protein VIK60_08335 [Vicinamibacterales bacterium]
MRPGNHHTSEIPSILAIEPDPDRAKVLTQLVHDYVDANVVVSASADVAVAVIARRMPELILLSALTPPGDERSLVAFLRHTTRACAPVLMVSPFFEPRPERAQASSGLQRMLGRRRGTRSESMRDALGARMRGALERSREESKSNTGAGFVEVIGEPGAAHEDAVCVPRAHRWTARDLSWLSGVRLSSGVMGQLVNISNSGLLVESDSALMPGRSVTFELCSNATNLWRPSTDLIVPAHVVRSEVSKVGPDRLRYLVAARFSQELELVSDYPMDDGASIDVPIPENQATATAADGIGDVARRAAEGLQELARMLDSLEPAVARISPRRLDSAADCGPIEVAVPVPDPIG